MSRGAHREEELLLQVPGRMGGAEQTWKPHRGEDRPGPRLLVGFLWTESGVTAVPGRGTSRERGSEEQDMAGSQDG